MKLHELAPKIKKPARRRKGQGNATGNGTYAGRGCNGQNSRSGGGVRLGFEGGQTTLIQRMPKNKGFRNINRVESQVIKLGQLEESFEDGEKVNLASLLEKGLIGKNDTKVKILTEGTLEKKIIVEAGILFSVTAKAAIEKAGGTIAS
ncbi:50S ribosomal protein L15 [Candidatus Gracilibacteria bacterium]|nr:50S ribosomal protein L15 [Candidatus Gracilibacteria bacterium]